MITQIKKEFLELIRSYRLLILVGIFLIVGMLSPLTARFMNEILKFATESEEGLNIIISKEPSVADSWFQYNNNISQIGNFAFVFIFFDFINYEKESGKLVIPFSKGLSPTRLLSSKILTTIITYIFITLVSYLICLFYTKILFDEVALNNSLYIYTLNVTYGIFIVSIIALANTIMNTRWITLLVVAAMLFIPSVVLTLLNVDITTPFSISSFNVLQYFNTNIKLNLFVIVIEILIIYLLSFILIRNKRFY